MCWAQPLVIFFEVSCWWSCILQPCFPAKIAGLSMKVGCQKAGWNPAEGQNPGQPVDQDPEPHGESFRIHPGCSKWCQQRPENHDESWLQLWLRLCQSPEVFYPKLWVDICCDFSILPDEITCFLVIQRFFPAKFWIEIKKIQPPWHILPSLDRSSWGTSPGTRVFSIKKLVVSGECTVFKYDVTKIY